MSKLVIHYLCDDYSSIEYEPLTSLQRKLEEEHKNPEASHLVLFFDDPVNEWDETIPISLFRHILQNKNTSVSTFGPLAKLLTKELKPGIYLPKLIKPADLDTRSFETVTYENIQPLAQRMLDERLRREVHEFSSPFRDSSHRETVRLIFGAWLNGLLDVEQAYHKLSKACLGEKIEFKEPLAYFERLEVLRVYSYPNSQKLNKKANPSKIILIDQRYKESGFDLILPEVCQSLDFEISQYSDFESYKRAMQKEGFDENTIACFFLDLKFNGEFKGFSYLCKLRNLHLCVPIIIFTLYEDIHLGITAFEMGANDFLPKTTRDPGKRAIAKAFESFENVIKKYKGDNNVIIRNIWITINDITDAITESLSSGNLSEITKSVFDLFEDENLSFYFFYGFWNILLYKEFEAKDHKTIRNNNKTDQLNSLYIQSIQAQYRLAQLLEMAFKKLPKENLRQFAGETRAILARRFGPLLENEESDIFEKVYNAGIGSKHHVWRQRLKPDLDDLLNNMKIILKMYLFFLTDLDITVSSSGARLQRLNRENGLDTITPHYLSTQAEEHAKLSGFGYYPHDVRSEDAAERFLRGIRATNNVSEKIKKFSELLFISPESSRWHEAFACLSSHMPEDYEVISDLESLPDRTFSAVVVDFSIFSNFDNIAFFNKFYRIFRFTPVIVVSATSSLNERSYWIQQVGTYFFPKDPDIFKESEVKLYADSFFSLLTCCQKNDENNELWGLIRNAWHKVAFFDHQMWKTKFGDITCSNCEIQVENMTAKIESFFHTMEISLCTRFYHRKMKYHILYNNLFDKRYKHPEFYISSGKIAEAAMQFLWDVSGKKESGGMKRIFDISTDFEELKEPCYNLWDSRNAYCHPAKKRKTIPPINDLVDNLIFIINELPTQNRCLTCIHKRTV